MKGERYNLSNVEKAVMANQIADDFHYFWRKFHEHPQPYDDKMDADIHERYAKVLREQSEWGYFDFKKNPQGIKRPFFGPSSAGLTDRELYERACRSKRDKPQFTQNQRDWVGLGTVVGDYVIREILLSERHYEKLTGEMPRFKVARNKDGNPAYEHFVKKMHEIEHGGEHFAYFGLPDGILEYVTDDGEIINVGLEVKSVQQNWSQFKSLDQPKPAHVAQTVAYSDMYGLDYVIVLYVLTYGRGWFEEFSRIKPFGLHITESDREHLRDRCAEATRQAREKTPPPFDDLSEWRFNDYKEVVAKGLTEEELNNLREQARRAEHSTLPNYMKRNYAEAIEEIEAIRNE